LFCLSCAFIGFRLLSIQRLSSVFCISVSHTAPTEIYTLSLHDALPILRGLSLGRPLARKIPRTAAGSSALAPRPYTVSVGNATRDRKSTRLNSSHVKISYAVFCLKKKKQQTSTKVKR